MGSIVYEGRATVIPDEYQEFLLVTDHGQYPINTEMHSVKISATERHLYLFDAFTNHSCAPTTYSLVTAEHTPEEFLTIALVNISPNDEITSDYNALEYDASDPQKIIPQCQCGAAACLGRIAGFKFLTTEQRRSLMPYVDVPTLQQWAAENPATVRYVPRMPDPEGVQFHVDASTGMVAMFATKPYEAGEIILSDYSEILLDTVQVVVALNNTHVWLDPLLHHTTPGEDGQWEYFGVGSFQTHSAAPNTTIKYAGAQPGKYCLVAHQPINVGMELTTAFLQR